MEEWIKDELGKINRKQAWICLNWHVLDDKNPTLEQTEEIEKTVRFGKVHLEKSTFELRRVCFKNYFKNTGKTCFVVVEFYEFCIETVTVTWKNGKY